MNVVVDASAVLDLLLAATSPRSVVDVMAAVDADLNIPALCDVEVISVLRREVLGARLDPPEAGSALRDYIDLPMSRHDHLPLLPRIFDLRENFSPPDATYVALAERLDASVLTTDRRMARAIERHTDVVVLP